MCREKKQLSRSRREKGEADKKAKLSWSFDPGFLFDGRKESLAPHYLPAYPTETVRR